jgi:hypothetical protein
MGDNEQANLGSYEFSWNAKIWIAAAALLTGVAGAQVIRSKRRNGRPREELVDNAMANFERDEIDDASPGPVERTAPEGFEHPEHSTSHDGHDLDWSAPGLWWATEFEMGSPSSTVTLEQKAAGSSAPEPRVSRSANLSHKRAKFVEPAARTPRSSLRNLLAAAWLFVCLTLAGYFGLAGLGEQGRSKPSQVVLAAERLTKPIEQIRVGDRVLGLNPELDQAARSTPDPDPVSWRTVRLQMPKRSGELLDIELLRPRSWIASMGAKEGSDIDLDLPELGAVGKAHVLSVGPCPDINPGEGRVVTGTFAHPPSEQIVDVRLEGSDVRISCTENHLFWSEDRGQFVPASQLEDGEHVRTSDGSTSTIASITVHPSCRRVYNLEVHAEHVYLVSTFGVLVHNMCEVEPPGAPRELPSGLRTWQEAGISRADAQRIQNAATRTNQRITVVGSRARGEAEALSDWDYIVSGPSRQRGRAKTSVPRGNAGGEIGPSGRETGIDWWQDYNPNAPNYNPLDPSRPHVIFEPGGRP